MNKNTQNNKSKKLISSSYIRLSVYVLAAFAVLFLIVGILAKYVHNNSSTSVALAHEFYFESDYLTEEGKIYEISADAELITVRLQNYPDSLRFASDDIDYKVVVTEDGNPISVDDSEGELKGNKSSSKNIEIPVISGKTYEVVATGDAGFVKEISATFVVREKEQVVYKSVENFNEYVLLTVWTLDLKGDVSITFPSALIPDNTDDIMKNVKSAAPSFVDDVNFTESYSSHTYRFFKSSAGDISAESFAVTCNGKTATIKIPERSLT